MVELARLERVYGRKVIQGSNPCLSARRIVELFAEVKDNERGREGLSGAPTLPQKPVFWPTLSRSGTS